MLPMPSLLHPALAAVASCVSGVSFVSFVVIVFSLLDSEPL
jgi:hypothetical protein